MTTAQQMIRDALTAADEYTGEGDGTALSVIDCMQPLADLPAITMWLEVEHPRMLAATSPGFTAMPDDWQLLALESMQDWLEGRIDVLKCGA